MKKIIQQPKLWLIILLVVGAFLIKMFLPDIYACFPDVLSPDRYGAILVLFPYEIDMFALYLFGQLLKNGRFRTCGTVLQAIACFFFVIFGITAIAFLFHFLPPAIGELLPAAFSAFPGKG